MKRQVRRVLRWLLWRESRLMSQFHIGVDWLALRVRQGNMTAWKKGLLWTLKAYYWLKEEGDKDVC